MNRAYLYDHTIHVIDDVVETKYKKQLEMMYNDSDKGSFASIFGCIEVDIMFIQYLLRHDFTLFATKPDGLSGYSWEEIKNPFDWGIQYSFLKVIWD